MIQIITAWRFSLNRYISCFKTIAVKTCVIFTVFFLTFFTIGICINVPSETFGLDKAYMILLFSFLLSACSYIFRIPSIPSFACYLLHFFCCGLSCYLIFISWLGYGKNGSMTLMVLFFFAVIYAMWLGVTAIFKGGKKKKAEKKMTYESQFKPSSKKK